MIFDFKNTFFTSDLHFYHVNIPKYSNRLDPVTGKIFEDMDRMTEVLIENWNCKIQKDSSVFVLGDFAMGGKSRTEQVRDILKRLNGTKYLIKGNHDTYVLRQPCVELFSFVKDYFEATIENESDKYTFIMSHYPMLTWNGAGKNNCYHLHGHSHGSINHLNKDTTRLDVGVDNNNLFPFSCSDIIKHFEHVKYAEIDHHNQQTSYY